MLEVLQPSSLVSERKTINCAETVRCKIINKHGKILLLKKGLNSKNPGKYEFPGGQIDTIIGDSSTKQEQEAAVIREIYEETRLNISNLPIIKKQSFKYNFDLNGIRYSRVVHLFQAKLLLENNNIQINQTSNSNGQSEDKHDEFTWVTPDEFIELQKNKKIAANSIQSKLKY